MQATEVKSVVTWVWTGTHLGARPYAPEHANLLRRQFAKHMSEKHRFICIADSTHGFDKEVEVLVTPKSALDVGKHRSPEGGRFPSCYRRLWTFSEEAKVLGDLIMAVDVDLVVTRKVDSLWAMGEEHDFVGWRPMRDWGAKRRFGGGIYLLKPGTRTRVWDDFHGAASIQRARAAGYRGSDQAWISYCLASKEVCWPQRSGIYSIRDMKDRERYLPEDAILVQFNGPTKPWQSPLPWVQEHLRGV